MSGPFFSWLNIPSGLPTGRDERKMLQRFKVTKHPDSSGEIEVEIDAAYDIEVKTIYVTLPAYTSNIVRDVRIRRPDGSILGVQKAVYKTSEPCGLIFKGPFLFTIYDQKVVVDTATVIVTAIGDITFDCVYTRVEYER